jgi:hypothetical protein
MEPTESIAAMDRMQTDKMKSTGNEMQKHKASGEKYSKRGGKHKKAGE